MSARHDPFDVPLLDYFRSRSPRGDDLKACSKFSAAVSALRRMLALGDKPATLGHLSTPRVQALGTWLVELHGRKPSTADTICGDLARVARLAVADGLLAEPVRYQPLRRRTGARRMPFTLAEIERLLGQCLLETADVAGVPGRDWWPALVLLILNLQISAPAVLALPRSALRWRKGCYELAAGDGFLYSIHPLTAAALARLPGDRPRLLPWTGARHDMLFYHFNRLARAAGVARQKGLSFDRLKAAQLAGVELLEQIEPARVDRLAAELRLAAERRGARQAERDAQRHVERCREAQAAVPKFRRRPKELREIYTIASDAPRTLRRFFRDVYYPRRLLPFNASEATRERYESGFNRLAAFTGGEVTLDGLARPGFLEDFRSWTIASGRSQATANSNCAQLLAIWRYAKRKELIGGNPEYLDKLIPPKKNPVAWTLDEFNRLLAAAAELPGAFNGLPYAKLMPALLLLLFDTGLRVGAAIQLRSENLDGQGALNVDACTQKHKSDQRWPLSGQTFWALRALHPETREMLFAGPHREAGQKTPRSDVGLCYARLRKRLKRAIDAAGLAGGVKDGFHKVRRTSCTLVAKAGGRELAIEHLGHSSGKVTDRYIDMRFIERPDAVSLLPRPNFHVPCEPAGLLEYHPAEPEAEAAR